MGLSEHSHHAITEYVKGKTVAIVANAPGRYEGVDDHDIVIRINAAIPPKDGPNYRGTKTDVLACGIIRPLDEVLPAMDPEWLWWFKLTVRGQRGLQEAREWYAQKNKSAKLYLWKNGAEFELGEKVGEAPSTGLRLLWLMEHREPKSVTVYGMTFWGMDRGDNGQEPSWYSGKQHSSSHSPEKEWTYFKTLGYERLGDGHWRKR